MLGFAIDSILIAEEGNIHGLVIVSQTQEILSSQLKPVLYAFSFVANLAGKTIDVTNPESYFDYGS